MPRRIKCSSRVKQIFKANISTDLYSLCHRLDVCSSREKGDLKHDFTQANTLYFQPDVFEILKITLMTKTAAG